MYIIKLIRHKTPTKYKLDINVIRTSILFQVIILTTFSKFRFLFLVSFYHSFSNLRGIFQPSCTLIMMFTLFGIKIIINIFIKLIAHNLIITIMSLN